MNLFREGWKALIKSAQAVLTLAAAVSLVSAIFWSLASPRISPYISLPEDVVSLAAKLDKGFDEQGRAISRIQSDVRELKSNPVIVEYDRLRSRVVEPFCSNGQTCTAELVARRTPQGDKCGAPKGQRFVRNHNGIIRPASRPGAVSVTRLGEEWITLTIKFIVPEGSKPGRAEFFMALEYPGCPFAAKGAPVKESTIPLEFEIVGLPSSTQQINK